MRRIGHIEIHARILRRQSGKRERSLSVPDLQIIRNQCKPCRSPAAQHLQKIFFRSIFSAKKPAFRQRTIGQLVNAKHPLIRLFRFFQIPQLSAHIRVQIVQLQAFRIYSQSLPDAALRFRQIPVSDRKLGGLLQPRPFISIIPGSFPVQTHRFFCLPIFFQCPGIVKIYFSVPGIGVSENAPVHRLLKVAKRFLHPGLLHHQKPHGVIASGISRISAQRLFIIRLRPHRHMPVLFQMQALQIQFFLAFDFFRFSCRLMRLRFLPSLKERLLILIGNNRCPLLIFQPDGNIFFLRLRRNWNCAAICPARSQIRSFLMDQLRLHRDPDVRPRLL